MRTSVRTLSTESLGSQGRQDALCVRLFLFVCVRASRPIVGRNKLVGEGDPCPEESAYLGNGRTTREKLGQKGDATTGRRCS